MTVKKVLTSLTKYFTIIATCLATCWGSLKYGFKIDYAVNAHAETIKSWKPVIEEIPVLKARMDAISQRVERVDTNVQFLVNRELQKKNANLQSD